MAHPVTSKRIGVTDVAVFGDTGTSTNPIALRNSVSVFKNATGTTPAVVANAGSGTVRNETPSTSGDLWSIGNVDLATPGAIIQGDLRTPGSVTPATGQVTGTSFTGPTNGRINLGQTIVGITFPVPPPDINTNQNQTLLPGGYGNVTMNAGQLTLSPGTYTFESMILNTGSVFFAVDTSGPVFVYIRKGLTFRATTGAFNPANLRFVVFGTDGAVLEQTTTTPFLGTVVAMNGPTLLQGTRACQGALFGQSVRVEAGSIVHHVPFAFWESPTIIPPLT